MYSYIFNTRLLSELSSMWANEELAARGSKALYCKPQKEVMGVDEYTEILKREVTENAAELHDDMPMGLILLNGLMKRFPCK